MAPDADPPESRPPSLADLIELCRNLNGAGVRYVVIGGMAVNFAGLRRATEDRRGVEYASARGRVLEAEIGGVRIPFASPELLLESKNTVREKDAVDRMFLQALIAGKKA